MDYSNYSVDEIATFFVNNFNIKGKQGFGDGMSYELFLNDRKTYYKDESMAQIYVDNDDMRETIVKATKYEQNVYGDQLTEENTKKGLEIYKGAVEKYNRHNSVYKFLGRIFGFTNKERENIKNMEKVFEFNGITKEELTAAISSDETINAKVTALKNENKLVDPKFADRKKGLEDEVNKARDIRDAEEKQAEIDRKKEMQASIDALSPEERLQAERDAAYLIYSKTSYEEDLETLESINEYLLKNKENVEESINFLEKKEIQEGYKEAKKTYDETSKIIKTGNFDEKTQNAYDNARLIVQSYEKRLTNVKEYYKKEDQAKELLAKNPLTFDEFFEQRMAKEREQESEKAILNAFQNIIEEPTKEDMPKTQKDDFSVSQKTFTEKINSEFTKDVKDNLSEKKTNDSEKEVNKTLNQK